VASSAVKLLGRVVGRRTKERIKLYVENRGPLLSHFASKLLPDRFASFHRQRTFEAVYSRNKWGSEDGVRFYSGNGSRGEAVKFYTEHVAAILGETEIRLGYAPVVVDLGCGDFTVGAALTARCPDVKYVGCDIVEPLIAHHTAKHASGRVSFKRLDIVEDQLPPGDVVLIRQVLQHLSNADVARVLKKVGSYDTVVVTEGLPTQIEGEPNPDKPVGSGMRYDWRTGRGRGLELDLPPFNLKTSHVCTVEAPEYGRIVTHKVRFS
jgi:SAM-dependent methyltransferase